MAVALPYLQAARVTGGDASQFLQGQLSAEVLPLQPGEASFACYCSPRGQVYALLLVGRSADGFTLMGHQLLLPKILERLRMFVLRAQVEIAAAESTAVYGVPASELQASGEATVRLEGLDMGYRLGAPGEADPSAVAAWKAGEILRGVVWLEPATSERFIPQMLGFDRLGAVSFSKGCYPGQEIIARARYLGKVKRGPLLLRVDSGPALLAGSTVRVNDSGRWLEGTAIDSVAVETTDEGPQVLVSLVAPFPTGSVDAIEIEGRTYRCATM
jgi:folate-binding protein YgfZ